MNKPVTDIRNVGPAAKVMFDNVGITSAEQLRFLGANAAYSMVLQNGQRPHFIGYYTLVMGLQGRPWNDCRGTEKDKLRKVFDDLVLNAKPTEKGRDDIEAALDKLGVRSPN